MNRIRAGRIRILDNCVYSVVPILCDPRNPRLISSRLINVRRGELKSVTHELETRLAVLGQGYLDNIEPEQDLGIVEHAQPGERAARDAFLFLLVDRFDGPAEILARPRFHFDEDERIAIAADDVDLAAAAPFEIAIENLKAVPTQEPAGQSLAARSAPQMFGRR
jgi:hypothetical protein